MEKTTIYTSGISESQRVEINGRFGFEMGSLRVRYLGLPLLTKQMSKNDYMPLVEKIRARISSWTGRFLSYAGRLQLISSVINSLINFWLSAFRLPKACVGEIESLCSAFLWSGPELNGKKSKVAWQEVCKPKLEGGLGLRPIDEANKVSMLKLIWRLRNAGSLWSQCIQVNVLKGSSFWTVKESSKKGSWIWRKLLKYRELASSFFRIQIGNGETTSFWSDNWSKHGVLFELLGSRGYIDLGISSHATVVDAIRRGSRRNHRNPVLNAIKETIESYRGNNRLLQDDVCLWRRKGDVFLPVFSSKETWDTIRSPRPECRWAKGIWFKNSTPKLCFITWLAVLNKLNTGERMLSWNVAVNSDCSICQGTLETKSHLFFTCDYSSCVWKRLTKGIMGNRFTSAWDDIISILTCQGMDKMALFVLRYAFQISMYSIWRERNQRRHGAKHISANRLAMIIDKSIQNRLSTLTGKEGKKYQNILMYWFSTRV